MLTKSFRLSRNPARRVGRSNISGSRQGAPSAVGKIVTARIVQALGLLSVCTLAGLILTVKHDALSFLFFLGLPVAFAVTLSIARNPFIGLVAIVFIAQIGGLISPLVAWAPISAVKILTLATLISCFLSNERYQNRSYRQLAPTPGFLFLLLFAMFVLVSVLFARDLSKAVNYLEHLVGVYLLVYLIVILTTSPQRLEGLLLAIVASTLVSAIFVLGDWFAGTQLISHLGDVEAATWGDVLRSSGASDQSPTLAASMMLAGTSLALVYALRRPESRWLTIPTIVIGTLAIFLTLTRHTVLTYFLMFLWFLFKLRDHQRFPLLFTISLIAISSFVMFMPDELWERFGILLDPDQDRTIYRRMSYHIIGFDLLSKNTLLGVGVGNFPVNFVDFDYRWIPGRSEVERPLHNLYLQVAVEVGLLGFICFMGILASCLYSINFVKRKSGSSNISTLAEAIQFSFVSLLIQALFLSSFFNKYLWIYIGLAIVLYRTCARWPSFRVTAWDNGLGAAKGLRQNPADRLLPR